MRKRRKVRGNDHIGDKEGQGDRQNNAGDFDSKTGGSDFDNSFRIEGAGIQFITTVFQGVVGKCGTQKCFQGFVGNDESTSKVASGSLDPPFVEVFIGSISR